MRQAERARRKVVVIDSLNGYLNAVPDERFLTTHLHELLTYLGQRGVVTILVGVQQGMLGGNMSSAMDASYLADNVLMLRYFEHDGEVKQAVSVFKKRGSLHERTIRRFSMTPRASTWARCCAATAASSPACRCRSAPTRRPAGRGGRDGAAHPDLRRGAGCACWPSKVLQSVGIETLVCGGSEGDLAGALAEAGAGALLVVEEVI
jgi:hypothetical protein